MIIRAFTVQAPGVNVLLVIWWENQTLEFPILQIICISSPPLGRVVKNAEMANWKRMQMNLFLFNFFSSSL